MHGGWGARTHGSTKEATVCTHCVRPVVNTVESTLLSDSPSSDTVQLRGRGQVTSALQTQFLSGCNGEA